MYPSSDYEILLYSQHRTRQLRAEATRRRLIRELRQAQPRPAARLAFWLGQRLVSAGARLQARAGSVPPPASMVERQSWRRTTAL